MRARVAWVTLASIAMCSCMRPPDAYPPPPQYVMPPGPEPPASTYIRTEPLLVMSEPDINPHILQDVIESPDGEEWRWTNQHPQLSLSLDRVEKLNFYMRFTLVAETLRDTGPVTLTIRIDDRVLARPKFDRPGNFEFRQAVPAAMLTTQRPVIIAVDVDPPWTSPEKTTLGIYLHSIGFQRPPK